MRGSHDPSNHAVAVADHAAQRSRSVSRCRGAARAPGDDVRRHDRRGRHSPGGKRDDRRIEHRPARLQGDGRRVPEGQPRRTGLGPVLGHRRRLQEVLRRRDRHQRRVASDQCGREPGVPGEAHRVHRAADCVRQSVGRGQYEATRSSSASRSPSSRKCGSRRRKAR